MARPKYSWFMALIEQVNDSNTHIISSDIAVVIKDKFPKAKYHFLVLPKSDIPSISHLTRDHLALLEELHLLAVNIVELQRHDLDGYMIGFHAIPSMERLHLHVVSRDFVSDSLKTKQHWNSFNTKFFLKFEDVYDELQKYGHIKQMSKYEMKELLSTKMQCNQCKYVAENMPKLKKHLLQHWRDKTVDGMHTQAHDPLCVQ